MAVARRLQSGAYQTRASKKIGNKLITKSFTVHPDRTGGDAKRAKQQSELLAREWQMQIHDEAVFGLKVKTALEDYIKDREKVLSPRTIHDYRLILPYFKSVSDIFLSDLKTAQIQSLVNEWSGSVSKKTIVNRISLLMAALDYAGYDKRIRLRYPQKAAKKVEAPDINDIKKLLSAAGPNFRPIILLAAYGSLRRGEICALKQKDISRDMSSVHVHADMVQTDDGIKYKDLPKTAGSVRVIYFPREIIDLLPFSEDPEAYVFDITLNSVTSTFSRLRDKCGLRCSFHSLRHFAASFRSDLNIPSKYIEEVGGWKDESKVMKRIYDNTLGSSRKKYNKMAADYFTENILTGAQ